MDCADFGGAVLMPGRVLSLAACTFMGFALALGGCVVFTAFGACFMRASAFRGMMSEFLTFVALNQLELGVIFLWEESLVINVEFHV